MFKEIFKECTQEHISYQKIDEEHVKKCHYDVNGRLKKEKIVNVRKVHQNRRSHRNVDDFFEDMIWNYGYKGLI